jgi:hypothetical protein
MEVQLSASARPERGTSKARSLRWHSYGCFSSSLFNDILSFLEVPERSLESIGGLLEAAVSLS